MTMTKNSSGSAWMLFPVTLLLLLIASGAGRGGSFIDHLKDRLQHYNDTFTIERTYLLTDRYVYRPGEDLWFRGFVSTLNSNGKLNSEDLFIKLINSTGEEIIFRRYPLEENESSGRLVIPRSCIPGKYWLVAYTGWMKNRCPEEAFRKEILVSRYFDKRFQADIIYDRLIYFPGDTLNAHIRILDASGKPVPETPFEYAVGTFKKNEIKGNGITDVKGKSKISFVVPPIEELLMLTLEIRHRKISGDFSSIIPGVAGKPVVSFFAEGGHLVKGIRSNVAFKVMNQYDLPVMITGVILNNQGKIIDTVHSGSSGLGKFEILPDMESASLKIINPQGLTGMYALPEAREQGMVIHYEKTSNDTAEFSLISSDDRSQETYWVGVMNRKIVWAETINIEGKTHVGVPLSGLKPGILQVSIFDNNHRLAAERAIHVEGNDQKLRVKLERQVFHSRQRINLLVEYPKDLIHGNLALSVSLDNLARNPDSPDFSTFINSFSCESPDIKHFAHDDVALMTSGFQSVSWKEILSENPEDKAYVRQDGIAGKVVDKKDNNAPHAKVRVTHFPNLRLYETQTDENGSFHVIFGSEVIDYKFLTIDAYDAMGKTSLYTRVDQKYYDELKKSLIGKSQNTEKEKIADLKKYGEPDLVYVLRFGPGKFRKSKTDTRKKYDPYQYAKYTDVMDIIQDIQPYFLHNNKIIFLEKDKPVADTAVLNEAIIVINGSLKGNDIASLKNLIPSDINNINISTSVLDVHKYTPLNFKGVIEITTIQGLSRYRQQGVQIGPGILNTEREFYSPDYAVETSYSADNRRTLYWNPGIPLFQGNSMLVTFYTSDMKGTYYGHLVGMDKEGNPVEEVFTFRVE